MAHPSASATPSWSGSSAWQKKPHAISHSGAGLDFTCGATLASRAFFSLATSGRRERIASATAPVASGHTPRSSA
eukprot:7388035-Prymnesium_polylepis.1